MYLMRKRNRLTRDGRESSTYSSVPINGNELFGSWKNGFNLEDSKVGLLCSCDFLKRRLSFNSNYKVKSLIHLVCYRIFVSFK